MKNKAFYIISAMMIFSLTSTSCNNRSEETLSNTISKIAQRHDDDDIHDSKTWGKVIEKKLSVKDFEQIAASGNVEIHFVQDKSFNVSVRANEKTLEALEVKTKNNTLSICTKNQGPLPVAYLYVTAPTLSNIELSGAAEIDMKQPVDLKGNLSLNVSGAGDIDINTLSCKRLNIELSGAGDVELENITAQDLNTTLSGAGDIDIKQITLTKNASFTVSGAGDIDAKVACNKLNITVSGSGSADLDVKAQTVEATASGTGDIELKGRTVKFIKSQSGLSEIRSKKLSAKQVSL